MQYIKEEVNKHYRNSEKNQIEILEMKFLLVK
jgi:hypothetical protein